ncbi:MAG: hypothetical protein ACSHX6_10415 [Akkermansiaceae bacterium]
MKPIHDIENMQPEAIELLEAAGYVDAKTIFNHPIADITTELIKANNVLDIIDTEPSRAMVAQWLKPIELQLGKKINDSAPEIDPSLLIEPKEILNTPFAVPLSENFIKEHHIDLAELPSGTVRFLNKEQALRHYDEEESIPVNYNVVSEQPSSKVAEPEKTGLFDDPVFTSKESPILDKNRILKMETFKQEGSSVASLDRDNGINLTKTTRKETNEGVSPDSKFYIKGVLHKNTSRFKSGCHSFLLVNFMILLSFAITSLVLIDRDQYWWAVWAPLLGILAIFIYFTAAQQASCPICNQKQFAPKRCLKHKSAHRWPIFGYMLPTAFHAIVFKWFRCIFCGTSVRLKE